MPALIGSYLRFSQFSEGQIGFLFSIEMLAVLCVSLSSVIWLKYLNPQTACLVALVFLFTFNCINIYYYELNLGFLALLLLRLLAGLATGFIYSIALVGIAKISSTHNLFAWLVVCQIAYGTLAFSVLPFLSNYYHFAALYMFYNAFVGLAILLFLLYPINKLFNKASLQVGFKSIRIAPRTLWVLLAVVTYYIVQGSIWGYIEAIGVSMGLTIAQIGMVLSLGFSLSILGAFYSQFIYKKIGGSTSVWLTVLMQTVCLIALLLPIQQTLWVFAVATILYQLLWSFIVPIMMSLLSDANDEHSALSISGFKCGLIIGPVIAAPLLKLASFTLLIMFAVVLLIITAALLAHAIKLKP
ncbi:MFS transporter [Pseudoalteromonas mariniglutinosa]|uniref:MFS transporter n=1 Tax=Pseudoalteromonas mariniglutinosa TaxID=206042 RepID=UPI00384F95EF